MTYGLAFSLFSSVHGRARPNLTGRLLKERRRGSCRSLSRAPEWSYPMVDATWTNVLLYGATREYEIYANEMGMYRRGEEGRKGQRDALGRWRRVGEDERNVGNAAPCQTTDRFARIRQRSESGFNRSTRCWIADTFECVNSTRASLCTTALASCPAIYAIGVLRPSCIRHTVYAAMNGQPRRNYANCA